MPFFPPTPKPTVATPTLNQVLTAGASSSHTIELTSEQNTTLWLSGGGGIQLEPGGHISFAEGGFTIQDDGTGEGGLQLIDGGGNSYSFSGGQFTTPDLLLKSPDGLYACEIFPYAGGTYIVTGNVYINAGLSTLNNMLDDGSGNTSIVGNLYIGTDGAVIQDDGTGNGGLQLIDGNGIIYNFNAGFKSSIIAADLLIATNDFNSGSASTISIGDNTTLSQINWSIAADGEINVCNGVNILNSDGIATGEVYTSYINFDASGITYVGNVDGVYLSGPVTIAGGYAGELTSILSTDNDGNLVINADAGVDFSQSAGDINFGYNTVYANSGLFASTINVSGYSGSANLGIVGDGVDNVLEITGSGGAASIYADGLISGASFSGSAFYLNSGDLAELVGGFIPDSAGLPIIDFGLNAPQFGGADTTYNGSLFRLDNRGSYPFFQILFQPQDDDNVNHQLLPFGIQNTGSTGVMPAVFIGWPTNGGTNTGYGTGDNLQVYGAIRAGTTITAPTIKGSYINTVVTKTSAYALTTSDSIVLVNSASNIVMTLPSASTATAGREYTIKTIQSAATIKTSASGQKIDGTDYSSSGYSLSANNKYITIVGDGSTNWYIVANN